MSGINEDQLSAPSFASDMSSAQEIVTEAYRLVLERDPDPEGLAVNMAALRAGELTEVGLYKMLLKAPEAAKIRKKAALSHLNDKKTVELFIEQIYVALLNRLPDVGGLENHYKRLSTQTVTPLEFIADIIFSDEFFDQNFSESKTDRQGRKDLLLVSYTNSVLEAARDGTWVCSDGFIDLLTKLGKDHPLSSNNFAETIMNFSAVGNA